MTIALSQSKIQNQKSKITAARRQVLNWLSSRGWKPFRYQRQSWNAYLNGESGVIHAATGAGKTYAVWLGAIIEALAETKTAQVVKGRGGRLKDAPPLRVLWITPLRALAADTLSTLAQPLLDLNIPWRLEARTGDTSSSVRARQKKSLPTALVTTPESLSLMLTRENCSAQFADLRLVVVDEWHELMATKRGAQVELALARLRALCPKLRVWGLSATLGNIETAKRVLLGETAADSATTFTGGPRKHYRVDSIIPKEIERFPWAGHLGLRLAGEVCAELDSARTSLVFTNTRSQAEQWYQAILKHRPQWAGQIALHHGSLDLSLRGWVEKNLSAGRLRCVVCTSSLDLGVDFSPVERVLQIGGPKGIARLLQRAGRSGHQPGVESRVTCVPTHAFELIEFAAAREALLAGQLEERAPPNLPLDVLVQHAITLATGEGLYKGKLFEEIRSSHAFRDLSESDWEWILDFITTGGPALRAYPDFRRVTVENGLYRVTDPAIARRHRMSIGTITSDSAMHVKFLDGSTLGSIEESFIARLAPGDVFTFAGRRLKLLRVRDMAAYVRLDHSAKGAIPRWMGGRLPLSTELAAAVRRKLDSAKRGEYDSTEMAAVRPILELQAAWSAVPAGDELLVERVRTREGQHIFLYPFAGRLVHEGLAALLAYRIAKRRPISFAMTVNDYGVELLTHEVIPFDEPVLRELLDPANVAEDILSSLNAAEMGRRQFREIAHVAGLLTPGYPGQPKSARQLQASAGLLYDVFSEYDPDNRLLWQSRREVLEKQMELTRLTQTLERLRASRFTFAAPPRVSPLAFPILVDRWRARLSSEKLSDRVRRMQVEQERAADRTTSPRRRPK